MRLLIVLALVAVARANVGSVQLQCPTEQWTMYRGQHEVTCMIVMQKEKTFEDAFEECGKLNATLVSFSHQWSKIEFTNKLVLEKTGSSDSTLWFFDKKSLHHKMMEKIPDKDEWLVIEVNPDPTKIKLMINPVKVSRRFICESPAQLVKQSPRFSREPENLQFSEDMITAFATPAKDKAMPKPMIATFNCHAFALPKPEIQWVMVYDDSTNNSLVIKPIDAEKIVDPRQPLKHETLEEIKFYDLRRDCETHRCRQNSMQEPSQLVMVNAQMFDTKYRIACIARNTIGSVISREAQIIVNKMAHFDKEEPTVVVKEGANETISCELETEPDSASVEWVRLVPRKDAPPVVETLEMINLRTRGSIQMSKSTFELLIDFAMPELAGRYACRVRMHNGRVGHVTRERFVMLEVEPCQGCDFGAKPLEVVEGYPTTLSMNPMSNEFIREGDDFLLECPCFGKRAPAEPLSVEWNMKPKSPKQLKMEPEGSVLLLSKADQTFAGSYACRCTRGDEKSEWSTTDVTIVPNVAPINQVDMLEVQAGATATLVCELPTVSIEGILINVTPMRGADSLTNWLKENNDSRFRLSATGGRYMIKIENTRPEDAGAYGCRISAQYFGKWLDVDSYYTMLKVKQE